MSAESARVVRHGWSHGQDFCRSRSGLAFVQHRRGQSSPAFLLSGKGLLSMFSPRELRSRGDRGTSAGDVETFSGSTSTVADCNSDDEPSKSMPMLSGLTVASGGGSTDTRFNAALIALRSCGCTRVVPSREQPHAQRVTMVTWGRHYGAWAKSDRHAQREVHEATAWTSRGSPWACTL